MNQQTNDDNRRVDVSVTLRQRVFDVDVEVTFSENVIAVHALYAFNGLSGVAVTALKEFADHHAQFLPTAPENSASVEEWHDVVSYHVQMFNGVKTVKVFTQQHAEHGIRIYPETLASAGYAIASMEAGIHTPMNWQVLVGKNGKGHATIKRLKTPSSSRH